MKRIIVIASHHKLALGMTDTLRYITNTDLEIITLAAYLDNTPVNQQIEKIMAKIPQTAETFIFTDMMAGSVNQGFEKYLDQDHTHLITGMNLPLIMAIALDSSPEYLTTTAIENLISEAQASIIYVNNAKVEIDEDDE